MVRHAEQVVFTTRIVPVERIRMVTRVVAGEQAVTTELRSDQVDLQTETSSTEITTP